MNPNPKKRRFSARIFAAAAGILAAFAGAIAVPMAANATEIDAITSVTIKTDPDTPLSVWQSFNVEATWAVPNDTVKGDSFTLTIPNPPMKAYAGTFDLIDNGEVAANCTATESEIHCVFTDYVESHDNVHGTLTFKAQAVQEWHEGDVIFTLNNDQAITVPVPGGGINPGVTDPAPTEPVKDSWVNTNGETITWRIIVPADELAKVNNQEILFEDTYDSRLTLNPNSLYVFYVKAADWDQDKNTSINQGTGPGTFGFTPDAANHSFEFWYNEPMTDPEYVYVFSYTTFLPDGVKAGDVFDNSVTANGQDYVEDHQTYAAPSGTVEGDQIGNISITKTVTGNAASLVPAGTTFSVDYSYTANGVDESGTLTIGNGETKSLTGIPTGTVVTLTEQAPAAQTGVDWGTPVFSGTGVTPTAGGATVTIQGGTTVAVALENPASGVPSVDIEKGDGSGQAIAHDADTAAEAEQYAEGETREIVFVVKNTGTEALRDVTLTDENLGGEQVKALTWTFPDGTSAAASLSGDVWTAKWDATFDGTTTWAPGAVIYGTATLTLAQTIELHSDSATVDAVGAASGKPVTDSDDYHAKPTPPVPAVDIEKGDGANKAIVHDADTAPEAEQYTDGEKREVVFVVTNTGNEALRNVELTDTTLGGEQVSAITWTFPDGSTAEATLVDGVWTAKWDATFDGTSTWAVGDVIYGTATLTLEDTIELHSDSATVKAVGDVTGTNVTDSDDYHAIPTAPVPAVDIEKGDGADKAITHDADTADDAEQYSTGEKREVVFVVTNTGNEALRNVELSDKTLSGTDIESLVWTMPDGTTVKATRANGVWSAKWDATFDGSATWAPGDVIMGTATLTLDGETVLHSDGATVNAVGVATGTPVTDTDEYHAAPPVVLGSPDTPDAPDSPLAMTGVPAQLGTFAAIAGVLLILGIGSVLIAGRRKKALSENAE